MEEVQPQFFTSSEITHENNVRLGHSVERTLALGTSVVTIGLAVQVALQRQHRVLDAARRTREFLGELVGANAVAIQSHAAEIGDVYNSPVIAIAKITQAHGDLIEAMDIAGRVKQESIESAQQNFTTLRAMTEELGRRSRGLPESEHAQLGLGA